MNFVVKTTIYSKAALYILSSLIIFAPLARGSVHPWAVTLIQTGVIVAALCLLSERLWDKRIKLPATPMHKPVIAVLLLCLVSFTFSDCKPFSFEGMVMLLIYITAFYSTLSSVRTRQDQRILVYTIIFSALLISVIGILKRFGIATLPWWLYPEVGLDHGAESVSGPYVNRNHMAGFLEMAIPFALALFWTRTRSREEKLALITISLFLLITQAFTLSRGGWMSTLGALLFMAAARLYQRNTIRGKSIAVMGTGLIIISLFFLASLPAVERLTTLTQQDYEDNMSGRLRCWKGVAGQIKANLLLGTGPNTFTEAYPAWQIPGNPVLRRNAHNDYLHFLSETGVFLIPVAAMTLFCFFRTGFRQCQSPSRQKSGFALAAMAGVFAILIHSFSDANLNIPANAFAFTVLAGTVRDRDK